MGLTNIPWCDFTLNTWEGCTKVSTGCAFCYAAERDKRHMIEPVDHWGKGAPRRLVKGARANAEGWNKRPWICNECGTAMDKPNGHKSKGGRYDCNFDVDEAPAHFHRARVFLGSLMDIFDDEVPIEWFAGALDTVRRCTQLDWLLVTKRPELFVPRVLEAALYSARDLINNPMQTTRQEDDLTEFLGGWAKCEVTPKNVWLITSTENQEMLEKRVPHLFRIPAVVHGLSCEPLLGPLDFAKPAVMDGPHSRIDWVISGGESGPSARPCQVEWIKDIQRQCQAADVAYFAKQLGSKPVQDLSAIVPEAADGEIQEDPLAAAQWDIQRHQSPLHLKSKKGEDMTEWPDESMRVRQWPEVQR